MSTTATPLPSSDAFLARISAGRSEARQKTADIKASVRSIHLETSHDKALRTALDRLLDSIHFELSFADDGSSPEVENRGGRAIIVVGFPGAGKSRAVKHALRTRPEFEGFGHRGAWSPVLSIVAPSPFSLAALGTEIVKALGYETETLIKQTKVWPMVRNLVRDQKVRVIHIDEAQHMDEIVSPVMKTEIRNTLKRLMQQEEWPVWLILSGLPETARFIQSDGSLQRRIEVVRFESLRFEADDDGNADVDHIRVVINRIAAPCPEMVPAGLLTDEFIHRLLHAATYQFGILVELVQDAIALALDRHDPEAYPAGPVVDKVDFADVYSDRTGVLSDDLNPFIADRWLDITVETAIYEQPTDETGKSTGKPALKARRT
jgi:hypothetical protein